MRFKLIFLLLPVLLFAEEPWGKDADLAHPLQAPSCSPPNGSPMAKISEALIHFHQNVISPADGPRSHYFPSSSQYTLEAIQKYGFLTGFWMGCDRLMRENNDPWVYEIIHLPDGRVMKHDPVR